MSADFLLDPNYLKRCEYQAITDTYFKYFGLSSESRKLARTLEEMALKAKYDDDLCLTKKNQSILTSIAKDLNEYPFCGEKEDPKYHFEHSGLKCNIGRNRVGVWVGFVEFSYDSKEDYDNQIHAHGDLYFDDEGIGFYMRHDYDIIPHEFLQDAFAAQHREEKIRKTYFDYENAKQQTKLLAEKLLERKQELTPQI